MRQCKVRAARVGVALWARAGAQCGWVGFGLWSEKEAMTDSPNVRIEASKSSKMSDAASKAPMTTADMKTVQATAATAQIPQGQSVAASKLASLVSVQAKTAAVADEEEEEESEELSIPVKETKLSSLAIPADYAMPQVKLQAGDLPVSLAGATHKLEQLPPQLNKAMGAQKKGGVKKKKKKGKGKKKSGSGKRAKEAKEATMMKMTDASVTAIGAEREQLGETEKDKRKPDKIRPPLKPATRRAICLGVIFGVIVMIVVIVVLATVEQSTSSEGITSTGNDTTTTSSDTTTTETTTETTTTP